MYCSSCGTELPENSAFCGKCGARVGGAATPAPAVFPSAGDDKILILIAHLGGIFFGFIPPLIVYLLRKDIPGVTLDNAREALNWQLTVLIGSIACFVLSFILIGLLLFWMLMVANTVFCIMAAVKSSSLQVFKYPVSIRVVNQ